jgi:hypothetical protein
MVIRTFQTYTLPMPFLTVQTPGTPLIKLEVDEINFSAGTGSRGGELIAKKSGAPVGAWNMDTVVGWWLKDHDDGK